MSAAMLNIATDAARQAGDLLVRRMDRIGRLHIDSKGRNDFVTEVDYEAEQSILASIRKAYPQHQILAEESGTSGRGAYQWIIDPLDGTTNYLHGCPQFSVSIALLHRGRIIHGVVYDPLRQEMFTTSRGDGAHLNDRRIRVGQQYRLREALLGTGLPFRNLERLDPYLPTLREMCRCTAGVRRFGSAALDLAWVACGRLDGFWEFDLKPWDLAAGLLLIRESGGIATSLQLREECLDTGEVVAGNPQIHGLMCKHLLACMNAQQNVQTVPSAGTPPRRKDSQRRSKPHGTPRGTAPRSTPGKPRQRTRARR